MLRSLYAGITGLRNHQLRMDVIGNNIANVNTVGYKASRVTFKELFNQTLQAASAPQGGRGGTNPIQVGLGTTLAGIDVMHVQGPAEYTGGRTDLAIQGDGFFVLSGPDGQVYTRAGDFRLDAEGYLVNSDGYYVLGTDNNPIQIDISDTNLASFSIDKLGNVIRINRDGTTQTIAQIALALFANPSGLLRDGGVFRESPNSGNADIDAPGSGGRGTLIPEALEMSNVDLSREFVDMIVTQRGFQASSRVITASDEMLQELVNLKR